VAIKKGEMWGKRAILECGKVKCNFVRAELLWPLVGGWVNRGIWGWWLAENRGSTRQTGLNNAGIHPIITVKRPQCQKQMKSRGKARALTCHRGQEADVSPVRTISIWLSWSWRSWRSCSSLACYPVYLFQPITRSINGFYSWLVNIMVIHPSSLLSSLSFWEMAFFPTLQQA